MSPHTVARRRADGTTARTFYYQCGRRYSNGPRACDHTRSYPAATLEESAREAAQTLLSEPKRLQSAYEKEIERKRRKMRGDPDKEARVLEEKLYAEKAARHPGRG